MGNDTTAAQLQRLIDLEARKDSIEFGPANGRIKVYVNSNDPQAAIENIQAMIDLRLYADTATPQALHRKQQGPEPPHDVVSGTSEEGRGA
jgi:hypothetical protein